MRLLLGSVFRSISTEKIMTVSLLLIMIALVVLYTGVSSYVPVIGLFLLGTGLGGGFPIMLGIVGDRFRNLSGTAFSFALVIALTGNTLINYCMGIIAQNFGVKHLVTLAFSLLAAMILLFITVTRRIKTTKS